MGVGDLTYRAPTWVVDPITGALRIYANGAEIVRLELTPSQALGLAGDLIRCSKATVDGRPPA